MRTTEDRLNTSSHDQRASPSDVYIQKRRLQSPRRSLYDSSLQQGFGVRRRPARLLVPPPFGGCYVRVGNRGGRKTSLFQTEGRS